MGQSLTYYKVRFSSPMIYIGFLSTIITWDIIIIHVNTDMYTGVCVYAYVEVEGPPARNRRCPRHANVRFQSNCKYYELQSRQANNLHQPTGAGTVVTTLLWFIFTHTQAKTKHTHTTTVERDRGVVAYIRVFDTRSDITMNAVVILN